MGGNVAALAGVCVKGMLPYPGGFLALGVHYLCLLHVARNKVAALCVLAASVATAVVQVDPGQSPPTADNQRT